MDELSEKLAQARRHVTAGWTDSELELALLALHRRRRRRAAARGVAAAALALGAALLWARPFASRPQESLVGPAAEASGAPAPSREPPRPGPTELDDGSLLEPLSPESRVVVAQVTPRQTRVRLESGRARFQVAPRPEREFQVDVGRLSVVALGTVFDVWREPTRCRVAVARGAVRVSWGSGASVVQAGEGRWFPLPSEPPEPTPEPVPAPAVKPSAKHRPGALAWRDLAHDGRYEEAFHLLRQPAAAEVRDEPQDLLLAADSARLSGHPSQAVPYLSAVVERHSGDRRAPLAAFALGRVLLQLDRCREAAAAFARARALDADGELAEDALAREAESWDRAGERQQASSAAAEYLRLYPEGRRAGEVRRRGGRD